MLLSLVHPWKKMLSARDKTARAGIPLSLAEKAKTRVVWASPPWLPKQNHSWNAARGAGLATARVQKSIRLLNGHKPNKTSTGLAGITLRLSSECCSSKFSCRSGQVCRSPGLCLVAACLEHVTGLSLIRARFIMLKIRSGPCSKSQPS